MRTRKSPLGLMSFLLTLTICSLTLAQQPTTRPDLTIDAATRSQVVEAVVKNMRDWYVFPEVGKEVERAVREHQRAGEYDSIKSAAALAKTLTRQLHKGSTEIFKLVHYLHHRLS